MHGGTHHHALRAAHRSALAKLSAVLEKKVHSSRRQLVHYLFSTPCTEYTYCTAPVMSPVSPAMHAVYNVRMLHSYIRTSKYTSPLFALYVLDNKNSSDRRDANERSCECAIRNAAAMLPLALPRPK